MPRFSTNNKPIVPGMLVELSTSVEYWYIYTRGRYHLMMLTIIHTGAVINLGWHNDVYVETTARYDRRLPLSRWLAALRCPYPENV